MIDGEYVLRVGICPIETELKTNAEQFHSRPAPRVQLNYCLLDQLWPRVRLGMRLRLVVGGVTEVMVSSPE